MKPAHAVDPGQGPGLLVLMGIFPALAIVTDLALGLAMSAALSGVMLVSVPAISLIRRQITPRLRQITALMVVATTTILADQFLLAFAFWIHRDLSIYVGLIVANCVFWKEAEEGAFQRSPFESLWRASWVAAAISLVLCLTGALREIFGNGTILGQSLPIFREAGIRPLAFLQTAPAAFFVAGTLIFAFTVLRQGIRRRLPGPFRERNR